MYNLCASNNRYSGKGKKNNNMKTELISFLEQRSDISITLKSGELREVINNWAHQALAEVTEKTKKTPETYHSRNETARRLGVNLSTLWHYDKKNYLSPVKVGGRRLYKESDIQRILEG